MNLRHKDVPVMPQPIRKKRRTSAEVAADKAAKELMKHAILQEKTKATLAKVLQISRKENAMAAEDQLADAQADHPPKRPMIKVPRHVTLALAPKPQVTETEADDNADNSQSQGKRAIRNS